MKAEDNDRRDLGHASQIGMLTVAEFCKLYKVGRTKAYSLFASGEIPARQIDETMTRVRVVDAEAWASKLPVWQPKER
jgi:hypothetical protein